MEYVIRPKRVPATNKIRYYMLVAPVKPVELADIAARIERTSTVSSADIRPCLTPCSMRSESKSRQATAYVLETSVRSAPPLLARAWTRQKT